MAGESVGCLLKLRYMSLMASRMVADQTRIFKANAHLQGPLTPQFQLFSEVDCKVPVVCDGKHITQVSEMGSVTCLY